MLWWKIKTRITSLAAANSVGDKTKKQQSFKNVKFLLCLYKNQRKSWMNGVLLEEWVSELDKKFVSERRKTGIHNGPVHRQVENLKSIKLLFLPPNTTSQIQPMDQNVIISLKAQYCKNVVRAKLSEVLRRKKLSQKFLCY